MEEKEEITKFKAYRAAVRLQKSLNDLMAKNEWGEVAPIADEICRIAENYHRHLPAREALSDEQKWQLCIVLGVACTTIIALPYLQTEENLQTVLTYADLVAQYERQPEHIQTLKENADQAAKWLKVPPRRYKTLGHLSMEA